jgi:hypothetical protein
MLDGPDMTRAGGNNNVRSGAPEGSWLYSGNTMCMKLPKCWGCELVGADGGCVERVRGSQSPHNRKRC